MQERVEPLRFLYIILYISRNQGLKVFSRTITAYAWQKLKIVRNEVSLEKREVCSTDGVIDKRNVKGSLSHCYIYVYI